MKGYKCQNKTAREILEALGFDPTLANRGWVLERTGGKNNKGAPVRMHALIHLDAENNEYIDIHADHQGPNDTHVTTRGRRTERWKEICRQIDANKKCNAGNKLLNHYGALREALEIYHANRKKQQEEGTIN